MKRLLALLLSLACLSTGAATVADRSPFAQGLWWDQSRPGSGFDLMNTSTTVMVVWYTYDASGAPTWFTAQGAKDTIGQAWPLLKHLWTNGKHQDPATVGSLKLAVNHAESVNVTWQLDGTSGTTSIVPFILSGVGKEVDHSGLWFDPSNPGWGLSITEQGPFNGAALFYYDLAGNPTWASGFERGQGRVTLFRGSGACPACTYRPPAMVSVGTLSLDYAQEAFLTLGDGTGLAMPAGINAGGARMTQLGRPASMRAPDRSLVAFDDAALLAYMKTAILTLPVLSSGVDFSASPAPAVPSTAFSDTNLQEAGVDEASLVKSDGTYIYTYAQSGNTFTPSSAPRLPEVRVAKVAGNGAQFTVLGSTRLGSIFEQIPTAAAGLYLRDRQLVSLLGTATPATSYGYAWSPGTQWQQGKTRIDILDTTDPAAMANRGQFLLDGFLVASRRIGNMLYVVSRFAPIIDGLVANAPAGSIAAGNNSRILAATPLDKFLPGFTEPGRQPVKFATANIMLPPQAGRAPVADVVAIYAIDLDALRVTDTLAIVGGTEVAYASTSDLVVATTRTDYRGPLGALLVSEPYFQRTDVHMIPLSGARLGTPATGSVEGYLDSNLDKAAFRFGESAGLLRVVTTSNALWGVTVKNRLTVLQRSPNVPGMLSTLSWLPNDARPDPIGKTGELLYATRFAGDRLYAVTFRVIDPLYVVDLSNSADPRIAGSLAVTGYSDYLHPLPNGFLMGVGKDALPADTSGDGNFAWYQGLQVALYDVRDATKPVQVDRALVGKRGSNTALTNSHQALSVLSLPDGTLQVALPAAVADGVPFFNNGPSTTYAWSYNALLRYRIEGLAANAPKFTALAPLVTSQASQFQTASPPDDVSGNGRSVLFPSGSVYIGSGKFWHQDAAGNTTGPF